LFSGVGPLQEILNGFHPEAMGQPPVVEGLLTRVNATAAAPQLRDPETGIDRKGILTRAAAGGKARRPRGGIQAIFKDFLSYPSGDVRVDGGLAGRELDD
jgi:hypothetical protein